MEAQRFPDDFDGIMGGAAASNNIPLLSGFDFDAQQTTNPNNPAGFVPNSSLANVTNAVQTACASAKTVATDNFLGDPTQCTFNPQTLFAHYLTSGQITAITNVYNGVNTAAGFAPGYEWGNEANKHRDLHVVIETTIALMAAAPGNAAL